MCCESCPKYEDCLVKDKIKDNCCTVCPDYDSCFSFEEKEEDIEEWGN